MVDAADSTNQPIFTKYKSPTDWPWPLHLLVAESRRILSYLKHLPNESQPPKSIWHSSKKCADFIEQSMKAREKGGSPLLEFSEKELESSAN